MPWSGCEAEASFIARSSVDMRRSAGFKRGEDGFEGADQVEHLTGGYQKRRAAIDGVGEGFGQDLERVNLLVGVGLRRAADRADGQGVLVTRLGHALGAEHMDAPDVWRGAHR